MPVIFISDEEMKKLNLTADKYEKLADKKEEMIKNDPKEIIPKSVFNQKLEEIKLLKKQIEETGNMVTSDKMKEELAIKEAEYKNELKAIEKQYKDDLAKKTKESLIKDHLVSEKCNYPELLLQQINLDDVIEKDNKILNMDSIILPLKDAYKNLFEKPVAGKTPVQGQNPTPQTTTPSSKEELIKAYEEAEKAGNYSLMAQAQRAINNLNTKPE